MMIFLLSLLTEVKKMRDLQKEYFKTRDKKTMMEAMIQEKVVDSLVSQAERELQREQQETIVDG
jgi:tRNA A37 threonylcarbamoyltransferase TsaD